MLSLEDIAGVKMQNHELSRRALLFGRKAAENEDGATAIEYGLLAALVGVAIIGGARLLGYSLTRKFRCMARSVEHNRRETRWDCAKWN